jgi:hypothetical protein
MEHPDALVGSLGYAAAGCPFEDHDNRFGEPIRLRRSTNSFDERSGCSWSISPPPRRPRPNHVRRIYQKHVASLTHPAVIRSREGLDCAPDNPNCLKVWRDRRSDP